MFEVEQRDEVTVLSLSHGKVNAIDVELAEGLAARIRDLAGSDTGAVVLTGAGRAFSAGVDLFRMLDEGSGYTDRFLPALSDLCNAFFEFPKPLVTAVNGAAVAGGCILACCGDRRLISDSGARIGAPELRVGVPFPVSPLEILRHACGRHTEDVVFGGRLYDGPEAVAVGIAHLVVPAADLVDRAVTVAGDLAAIPATVFRLAKEQLRRPVTERIAADASFVDEAVQAIWGSAETADVVRAYLDRTVGRA